MLFGAFISQTPALFRGLWTHKISAASIWVTNSSRPVCVNSVPRCCLQEKNFAFLEFRSVEESSNCMAFDGIAFRDCYLKVNLNAMS